MLFWIPTGTLQPARDAYGIPWGQFAILYLYTEILKYILNPA